MTEFRLEKMIKCWANIIQSSTKSRWTRFYSLELAEDVCVLGRDAAGLQHSHPEGEDAPHFQLTCQAVASAQLGLSDVAQFEVCGEPQGEVWAPARPRTHSFTKHQSISMTIHLGSIQQDHLASLFPLGSGGQNLRARGLQVWRPYPCHWFC